VGICQKHCQTLDIYEKQKKLHCCIHCDAYAKRTAGRVAATSASQVIELSQRRAQRQQVRGLLRNSLTWLLARYHGITAGRRFRRGFEGETIPRHT
jgi:hypothetical protein